MSFDHYDKPFTMPDSYYDPPDDRPCKDCWLELGYDMSLYDEDEGRLCRHHARIAYADAHSEPEYD